MRGIFIIFLVMLAFIPQDVKATRLVYFIRIIRKDLSLIPLYIFLGGGREGPCDKVIPKYTVCAVPTTSNGC